MNVLFFVEPLLERSRVYDKLVPWVQPWVVDMAAALRDFRGDCDFRVVVSEPLASRIDRLPPAALVALTQRELLAPFPGQGPLDIMIGWANDSHAPEIRSRYAALYSARLEGFAPDVILTFTPAPYLAVAFPGAVVLHFEGSLFGRAPLSPTWFFDPVGPIHPAFVCRYERELDLGRLRPDAERRVESLRRAIQNTIRGADVFGPELRQLREQHGSLVLLALPYFEDYATEGSCRYRAPLDLVMDCATRLPREVGLVITNHPTSTPLPTETTAWVERNHPNLFFVQPRPQARASSEHVLPFVDAVIHVASKVACSAVWWHKPVITLRRGHIPFLTDAHELDELERVLARPVPNRDAVLHWMLTHYAIAAPWMFRPAWLGSFFERCIERVRSCTATPQNYYDMIDDPDVIFDFYIDELVKARGCRRQ